MGCFPSWGGAWTRDSAFRYCRPSVMPAPPRLCCGCSAVAQVVSEKLSQHVIRNYDKFVEGVNEVIQVWWGRAFAAAYRGVAWWPWYCIRQCVQQCTPG